PLTLEIDEPSIARDMDAHGAPRVGLLKQLVPLAKRNSLGGAVRPVGDTRGRGFSHHRPPPAISVATGNCKTCPTRSHPGSTPGFSALVSATICPVCASGQHVSAMRQSVSPGMTTHS